jgi:hypothetical protein
MEEMNGQDDSAKAPASRSTGDFIGEALAGNRARFAVPPPPGLVSGTLAAAAEFTNSSIAIGAAPNLPQRRRCHS